MKNVECNKPTPGAGKIKKTVKVTGQGQLSGTHNGNTLVT